MSENEMKNFRECLQKAINEAPTSDVADELKKVLERCSPPATGGTVTTQSGGGGNTNPPQPGHQ